MNINKKKLFIKKYQKNWFRQYWWIIVLIISFGGLFYPLIGLFVPVFMITLLILSYSHGRYWCGNLCPRGSLNDHVIKRISMNKKIPDLLKSNLFRLSFLGLFMIIFSYRVYGVLTHFSGWNLLMKLGFIFATVCLITTIISLVLGIFYGSRSWCSFCPMGTMQKGIYKFGKKRRKEK